MSHFYCYAGCQWKIINCKQSARWHHLYQLKVSAFLFEFFLLGVKKHNNLYSRLVMPSSGWKPYFAGCHYAEHRYAECRCSVRHAEWHIFNVMLKVIYTECHYAEHRYAECRCSVRHHISIKCQKNLKIPYPCLFSL